MVWYKILRSSIFYVFYGHLLGLTSASGTGWRCCAGRPQRPRRRSMWRVCSTATPRLGGFARGRWQVCRGLDGGLFHAYSSPPKNDDP